MSKAYKKFSFRIFTILFITIIQSANSQVLILSRKLNDPAVKQVNKVLFNKMKLPERIFRHEVRKNCEPVKNDFSYDLVICIKKNGELIFPVYKKAILKNSYKSFL